MRKLLFILMFIPGYLFADCAPYKIDPAVTFSVPQYVENISIDPALVGATHGNVVSSFSEKYELQVASLKAPGGFCVVLSKVNAEIGYTEFQINISPDYEAGSCKYDFILQHEYMHKYTYLSVMESEKSRVEQALSATVNSIFPIFIEKEADVQKALDSFKKQINENPKMRLAIQKIQAEQEIRNRKVDESPDNKRFLECK